jgi:hypothetical protein
LLGLEKFDGEGWKNDLAHVVAGCAIVAVALWLPYLAGLAVGIGMEARSALMEKTPEWNLLDRLRDIAGYTLGGLSIWLVWRLV